jgi:hypothetical protein
METMRAIFTKLSDDRHQLEIVHDSGQREQMSCDTRNYLVHDLLHHAVETEGRLQTGFWGRLAHGTTLAELNDRTGASVHPPSAELMAVEQIVGALTGAAKGRSAQAVMSGLTEYASGLGHSWPDWLTENFIRAVQERMRRLLGRWKATPHGQSMELPWPDR